MEEVWLTFMETPWYMEAEDLIILRDMERFLDLPRLHETMSKTTNKQNKTNDWCYPVSIVIDHHKEEGASPSYLRNCPRVILVSGIWTQAVEYVSLEFPLTLKRLLRVPDSALHMHLIFLSFSEPSAFSPAVLVLRLHCDSLTLSDYMHPLGLGKDHVVILQ